MTAVLDKPFVLESVTATLGTTSASASSNLSPAFMLMQAQMLLTQSYDDQIREVADKIKFMKDVVGKYRDNIACVQKFLAQPTHDGKNKKQIIDATASQMAELCGALTDYNYNAGSKTMTATGIDLFDMEGYNNLNPDMSTWDGKTNTSEIKAEFEAMTATTTPEDYEELAMKFKDRGTMQLFFSYSQSVYNNTNRRQAGEGQRGLAVFDVYVEQLGNLVKKLEASMAKCDVEIDELTNKLTDLTEKRKASLELANQAVRKMNEINTNTVNKM